MIHVRVSGRRGGKTTAIIDKWLEDPANSVIYCGSLEEVMRIRYILSGMIQKGEIPDTIRDVWKNITIPQDRGASRGMSDPKILIDNLDMMLPTHYWGPAAEVWVAMTGEEW